MDCDICFEQYNTGVNIPKLTPCGHTVCLLCLQRTDKRECPLCRTAFGGHPAHLATNYTLLRLLEERYGDERIGPRLHQPHRVPVPPPIVPVPPPAPAPPPAEAPTVIIVRSTQGSAAVQDEDNSKRSLKIIVNVFAIACVIIYLLVRYCR